MINATQKNAIIRHLLPLGATKIGIFGSFARNENKPESDIDILLFVTQANKMSLLQVIKAEQDLSDELGIKVDLVTERSLHPLVRPFVEKDLKIIFE